MALDASVTVCGTIRSLDALENLADACELDLCGRDWDSALTAAGARHEFAKAAEESQSFKAYVIQESRPFANLIALCHEYGISYRMQSGPAGGGMREITYWSPGMDRPRVLESDSDADHPIRLSELKAAAEEGIDAVNALIKSLDAVNDMFEGGKLRISTAVMAEMRGKESRREYDRDGGSPGPRV